MPDPTEYTDEALLLFPIIIKLNVPFKSEELLVPSKGWKADYLVMAKIDVEVDGEAHGTSSHSRKDDRRDEELKRLLDIRVVRLTNQDAIERPEWCAMKIREEIEKLPKTVCGYSNQPHHHVPMMNRIWCMSARKYLEEN